MAQSRTVTGKVTSEEGGIPGVNVLLKGATTGTTTNAQGNYSLAVPDGNSTLVFSYIGYATEEIAIGNRSVVDVSLVPDIKSLSEVVVVGYGTVKRSDLTGSVATIKAQEINAFPATNVLQAMSGRAPGVQVIQNTGAPGAPVSVRIRGTNSIQGSNEPLYVVDGFPIAGSNPTVLNNSDIESIEVLKDASATAIYGSRGANGVVIITTKQGKAGKVTVDYEGSYSVQTLRKKLDMMNAREYATFYNLQAANDKLNPYFTQEQIDSFGEGYDWQNLVFRKAPMHNHNLTVSGGAAKTRFSVGASLFSQDGIIIGSDYKRYSLRANVNTEVSKKFSLSYGAILTNVQSSRQNSGGNNRGGSLISAAISAPPTLTPYNDDGTYRVLATAYSFISNVLTNPLNYTNEQTNDLNSNRVLANVGLTFTPVEGLAIKIAGGIENNDDRTDSYTTTRFINSQGSASVSAAQGRSLLSENTISYNKTIGTVHSVSAVAGLTYQDFLNTSLGGSGVGFLSDVTETANLAGANTPGIPGSGYSLSTLLSYLGRVNYSYNNKYLATVSFRADGSSKYSEGSKWGYFPSAALAWRVSEEEFLKNLTFVSDLKVRTSWGRTGSQAIGPYATLNILNGGKTVFGDILYNTFAPGTRLPGNLRWETTEQADVGFDAGFINNRYRLSVDYYVKNTRDLLNTVQLPVGFGFTNTLQNVGQIRNRGVEIALDAAVIDKAFKWNLGGNISFNRNKVVKLYGGQDILGGGIGVTIISDATSLLREGLPMSVFYGYRENGYTEQGKIAYQDLNGDGAINQLDKTVIGDPNPDFIYGLNSNMAFKGLELTIFLQGSQGNDLVNVSSVNNTLDYGFGLNMPREVLYNHWTPETPNAKYPVISRSNSYNYSDRLVEDGSFMRLRNIQLAYNLPVSGLGIGSWMRSAQVYVSGQNLLTFTRYSWWDPETNSQGGENSIGQGIDHYSYPTSKAVTFGVRLGL
jgi:TonB-linked SusC/RagA family outer membrane protein